MKVKSLMPVLTLIVVLSTLLFSPLGFVSAQDDSSDAEPIVEQDDASDVELAGPTTEEDDSADLEVCTTPEPVVGAFVTWADFYYEPGQLIDPQIGVPAGKTAWVLGMDESGEYYQILWANTTVWVLAETMGPNYDEVWNGAPLPTGVVCP